MVLWLCAGILAAGALIFVLFAAGEVQEWAKHKQEEPPKEADLENDENSVKSVPSKEAQRESNENQANSVQPKEAELENDENSAKDEELRL